MGGNGAASHEKLDSDALLSNNDQDDNDDLISKSDHDQHKERQGFEMFIDGDNDESRLSSLFTNDNQENTTNIQYINFASGRKASESLH